MTGTPQRHTEPLDVHLIALRDGTTGPEVLLSRRAGDVYAAGCWHLPSGHLDGPWEDMVTALVRETQEETSIVVDPADVHAAVTVHHRSPRRQSARRVLPRGPALARHPASHGTSGVRCHGLVHARRATAADGRVLPGRAGRLPGRSADGRAFPAAQRPDRLRPDRRPAGHGPRTRQPQRGS
ncbi:NUDIX domain-containing protein [Streptomyces sp. Tu 3180]|uniref:NUDIX domain-containing protein n=1 Tax=Streptomyces sp. Tu 3180 TaxID=2682611 RepID=UPI001FB7EC1E|nr:NUDIX domain-containing protein [Streptomyces sp. Tu 3180]